MIKHQIILIVALVIAINLIPLNGFISSVGVLALTVFVMVSTEKIFIDKDK